MGALAATNAGLDPFNLVAGSINGAVLLSGADVANLLSNDLSDELLGIDSIGKVSSEVLNVVTVVTPAERVVFGRQGSHKSLVFNPVEQRCLPSMPANTVPVVYDVRERLDFSKHAILGTPPLYRGCLSGLEKARLEPMHKSKLDDSKEKQSYR